MKRLGLPDDLCQLVESQYSEATTEIRKESKIQMKSGVRQGDPFSPYLFNTVLDEAVTRLEGEKVPGGRPACHHVIRR